MGGLEEVVAADGGVRSGLLPAIVRLRRACAGVVKPAGRTLNCLQLIAWNRYDQTRATHVVQQTSERGHQAVLLAVIVRACQ